MNICIDLSGEYFMALIIWSPFSCKLVIKYRNTFKLLYKEICIYNMLNMYELLCIFNIIIKLQRQLSRLGQRRKFCWNFTGKEVYQGQPWLSFAYLNIMFKNTKQSDIIQLQPLTLPIGFILIRNWTSFGPNKYQQQS